MTDKQLDARISELVHAILWVGGEIAIKGSGEKVPGVYKRAIKKLVKEYNA